MHTATFGLCRLFLSLPAGYTSGGAILGFDLSLTKCLQLWTLIMLCQGMVDRMYRERKSLIYAPKDIAGLVDVSLFDIVKAPRDNSKKAPRA